MPAPLARVGGVHVEESIGRECSERKLAYPLVQPTNNQRAQLTRDAHRRVGSAEAHKE